jgi:hypothetical protein
MGGGICVVVGRGVETGEADDEDELAEPQRPAACRCARDFRESWQEKRKREIKLHKMGLNGFEAHPHSGL